MNAYFRLMRIDKPIGTLLLWIPTAWALWMANHGSPPLSLLVYFFLGTVVMRSAGCVVNDMADRHIDKHVKRTQFRPLAHRDISFFNAFVLLIFLLVAALYIVLQLPIACLYYSFFALGFTLLYPLCKRFISAPQLVLGFAFSMGIPMAYAASGIAMSANAYVLILLNIAWIISYDTMYAMVDREDDLRIGVKSTAVLFARYDCAIILLLQLFVHAAWLYLAISLDYSGIFYLGWGLASIILAYQQYLISSRNASACFAAFSINGWYGLLIWLSQVATTIRWLLPIYQA